MVRKEIEALRRAMKEAGAAACLIPTADAHESEYPGEYFAARSYLSGFTGSAGTLAVTQDWAGLWTDARYFIQAKVQLAGSGITLYRMGEEGVPTLEEELAGRLETGDVLAYDGRTVNGKWGASLRQMAEKKGGRIQLLDLPGQIWTDRPELSAEPVFALPVEYTGEERREKLARVRKAMKEAGAGMHLVTTLDDIAWLTNLRGSDIPCNPVFFSYLVLKEEKAFLFVQQEAVPEEIRASLEADGICIEAYADFYGRLKEIGKDQIVMLDRRKVNERALEALQGANEILDRPNPSEAMKAVKNAAEIAHMKEAHRKDGAAVTSFICWLKRQMKEKKEVTELSAAKQLELFRRKQEDYLGPSFETIAAYGPHGAIVHYTADETTNALLKPEGFFLVDSGGQYLDGTTDVTRTIVLGTLSREQKKHFTAVLKGMLALGDARFLSGCRGVNLDYLAREPLWALGLDFKHGTGHGVGCLLNVHEAPNGFRWKSGPGVSDSAVLEPGMITSDEPGFYLEGQYGIRTENLLLCKEAEQTEYGRFLEFEFLTMAPIDKEGIAWEDMEPADVRRLNAYHKTVFETLAPCLEGEVLQWLKEATGEEIPR